MTDTIASGAIAFIGFGEAARAFLDGWRTEPGFAPASRPTTSRRIRPTLRCARESAPTTRPAKVIGASTAPEGVAGAEAVFSVVTADQAHEAALAALPGLAQGRLLLRLRFLRAADQGAERERGGRRRRTLCRRRRDGAGPSAPAPARRSSSAARMRKAARGPVARSGMHAPIHDGPVGSSSAIKMVRSVMIKGIEALVCECVLTGREGGRRRDGARFARRHLSRLRLAGALGLYARARDDAWRAPRGGNARGRADRRRLRPRRRDVARLRRMAAADRRSRPQDAAGRGQATIAYWPTRILVALTQK